MTETSRRAVLRASALAALGAVVAPFASAPTAFATRKTRTLYTRTRFRPLRRKRFKLVGGNRSWTVTLTKVSNLPGAAKGDKHAFALTFRTAVAGPPQGTYTLRRRRFTPTRLFLVPSDEGRRTYQAVINN